MTELTREDLPIWMQKTMRSTDWGVLIVLVFSLLAAAPFLLQPGLPRTNASEHYVFRAADDAQAFAEGQLYPRWTPNALTGFGAPIPQYYPPGAAYLPAILDFFITNDATLAVKLIYAAALCLAGSAVYAFVTRRSSAAAGVIAALLYVYSPYVAWVAPRVLGDLPGVICLALIPALLWSIDRLLRLNRTLDLCFAALITAGLLLTDVPATLVGWALAAALIAANTNAYSRWVLALGAGGLGIGLAACFWLPALAEADAVQWLSQSRALPNLLTLGGLFAPLRLTDPGALMPPPQFTLGLALPLFALASSLLLIRQRVVGQYIAVRHAGFHALFLMLALALTVLALAIFPSEVWLLGVITLCLSVGASAVAHAVIATPVIILRRNAYLVLPLLVIVVLLAALPIWLAPAGSNETIDTSAAAQIDYEQQGYGSAALPDSDPLPATIPVDTLPNRALTASYHAGQVNKVAQESNAQIGILSHTTNGDSFQVQTFAPLTLHILTAYFPGWTATYNNAPLTLTRSDDGLMDVAIPGETRGELTISLSDTPPRTLGWVIAGLALLLTAAISLVRARRPRDAGEVLDLLSNAEVRLLGVVGVGFAVVLALTALPFAPLPVGAQPNSALAGASTLDNHSASGLEVLAYRFDGTNADPGDTLRLTLYWHTLRFLTSDYQARVSLLDLTTGAYRQPTTLREPGGYPTSRWLPRLYVSDAYAIPLPSDFPAGNYSAALEVCASAGSDCLTPDSRLTFFDASGGSYGTVLVLPTILSVK